MVATRAAKAVIVYCAFPRAHVGLEGFEGHFHTPREELQVLLQCKDWG
jgi:hypothetical protein